MVNISEVVYFKPRRVTQSMVYTIRNHICKNITNSTYSTCSIYMCTLAYALREKKSKKYSFKYTYFFFIFQGNNHSYQDRLPGNLKRINQFHS